MAEEAAAEATTTEVTKEFSDQIKELGDALAKLTLKDAVDLKDYLKAHPGGRFRFQAEALLGEIAKMPPPVPTPPQRMKGEMVRFDDVMSHVGTRRNRIDQTAVWLD